MVVMDGGGIFIKLHKLGRYENGTVGGEDSLDLVLQELYQDLAMSGYPVTEDGTVNLCVGFHRQDFFLEQKCDILVEGPHGSAGGDELKICYICQGFNVRKLL